MRIITLCLEHMRSTGIQQWDEVYPNLQVVEEDARARTLFVIRYDERCVAAICLNEVQPEQYADLPWKITDGRALVIHRLCADPSWQQRGAARELMDFAETHAQQQSYSSIRLDAHTGNPRALALYKRRDYVRVGSAHFPRRPLPNACFE